MPDSPTFDYATLPLRWADTRTARLPLRQLGQGPDLLLVHGFPLSGYTWRRLLPRLSAHFRCHVVDLPGLGEAQWTRGHDFSFPGQGRCLRELVDALGLQRYHLIAQDTGGTFARFLALSDLDRVASLVLLNTEMPGHRPPWIPLYQALMPLAFAPALLQRLLRSRAFLRSPMGFGGCFVERDLIDGAFHRAFIAPLLESCERMEGLRQYLIGAKWPAVDALACDHARLTMPTLLLWGEQDPTFPAPLARQMAAQFPRATFVAVPDAKLLVHEE